MAEMVQRLVPPELSATGIDLEDVAVERRVGVGGFGVVYRASYRGVAVALKQPNRECSELDMRRFAGAAGSEGGRCPR